MRRIALVTLHTPTSTNYRGASALPFHLMAYRPRDIEVEIWSYNLNGGTTDQIAETENRLGIKIHIVAKPKWLRLLNPAPIRLLLSKPMLSYLPLSQSVIKEIQEFLGNKHESGLWIYGEDIATLVGKFKGIRSVVTTPDCEAMYYYRVLAMKDIPLRKSLVARYSLMYHRYARMAASFPVGEGIKYHLVGKEDTLFLRRLNPKIDARFIRHPHYDFTPHKIKEVASDEKIRMLIAGRYDFSMSQAVDEAIEAMQSLPSSIKDRYIVTFLGKGWDKCIDILRCSGISTEHKLFVEDYAAEVASHHIQLTPIAVGTGTKGKVLDAFANGLMVIGTPLALENIDVKNGVECVEYRSAEELVVWLGKIADHPEMVKEIAQAGSQAVLSKHSREKISNEFFNLFKAGSIN